MWVLRSVASMASRSHRDARAGMEQPPERGVRLAGVRPWGWPSADEHRRPPGLGPRTTNNSESWGPRAPPGLLRRVRAERAGGAVEGDLRLAGAGDARGPEAAATDAAEHL